MRDCDSLRKTQSGGMKPMADAPSVLECRSHALTNGRTATRGDSAERRAFDLTMRDCGSPLEREAVETADVGTLSSVHKAAHTPRPTGELAIAVTSAERRATFRR